MFESRSAAFVVDLGCKSVLNMIFEFYMPNIIMCANVLIYASQPVRYSYQDYGALL